MRGTKRNRKSATGAAESAAEEEDLAKGREELAAMGITDAGLEGTPEEQEEVDQRGNDALLGLTPVIMGVQTYPMTQATTLIINSLDNDIFTSPTGKFDEMEQPILAALEILCLVSMPVREAYAKWRKDPGLFRRMAEEALLELPAHPDDCLPIYNDVVNYVNSWQRTRVSVGLSLDMKKLAEKASPGGNA